MSSCLTDAHHRNITQRAEDCHDESHADQGKCSFNDVSGGWESNKVSGKNSQLRKYYYT